MKFYSGFYFIKYLFIGVGLSFFLSIRISSQYNTYNLNANKISLYFNNAGVIFSPSTVNNNLKQFENGQVFYSSGFFLSGISNGKNWANGVADATRIIDYLPGRVNDNPYNSLNKLYFFQNAKNFYKQWFDWKNAVSIGADFYDGNGNGLFDPADYNNNNKWDDDEDKPDYLGLNNLWCVYNDAVDKSLRRFFDVDPQGIEIQQTVFAQPASNYLNNVVFIRYRIINRGIVTDNIDSCYFSVYVNPEIGSPGDDLIGCDTLLSAGFAYNNGYDSLNFGINPPCLLTQILQGPTAFIPGISFIDNNNNKSFEKEYDLPLDTAYVYKGLMGIDTIPGACNLKMSSFSGTICAHPNFHEPNTKTEARNLLLGIDSRGNKLNPCNWNYGVVIPQTDCNKINPVFAYSGDPVSQTGWLSKNPCYFRMYTNVGPFSLIKNKPQDIIVAYIIGRGSDSLQSISVARQIAKNCLLFLKKNFGIDVPEAHNQNNNITKEFQFHLFQNFPNPFNPSTSIKFSIKKKDFITLTIYDLLGKEIIKLVNEEKDAGIYEVHFNPVEKFQGLSLQNGVYFYQLKAGNYIETKKMILIK